ncbi:GTP-binding protein [Ruminococcaceae bacterium OttesenSCG-928-I18]|nr:GTP-binding protein [Ruminococcaceae bacterium OttesenSCG-928-I18]
MEEKPIRLYLISGFLGAGKTTFLRSLLKTFQGLRLGVLVNEFGSVGIDGTLVHSEGIKLVEINNGSIFCACIKDGFIRTLKAFSQQPIDALLIESSGMADPAGMQKILQGMAPYLDRPYEYMGSICLVDCTTFVEYVDVLMPVQNQVASADLIIVNKTDLVGEDRLAEVQRFVRLLNDKAPVYNTIYSQIPMVLLENQLKNHGTVGQGSNTPYNRPSTYTLLSDAGLSGEKVRQFCAALAEKVLRFKGFLRDEEHGFWHLEGVAGQYTVERAHFEKTPRPERGRVVLISFGQEDVGPEVETAWAQCSSDPAELKEA